MIKHALFCESTKFISFVISCMSHSNYNFVITTNVWSEMTLNYQMIMERYPNYTEWLAVRFPAVRLSLYLKKNKKN